jgi:hypothetical protein
MTPRVPYPPRVVWPCRIAPEVLKELQELADWELEYRDPRMNLGKFVERELRETIKRYRRIKP